MDIVYPGQLFTLHVSQRQRAIKPGDEVVPKQYAEYNFEVPGLKRLYVYELVAVFEERTDCFCCSCGTRPGSDVACRNHGWAAQRPCEEHDQPGKPWGEEMCKEDCLSWTTQGKEHSKGCLFGQMPKTVQEVKNDGRWW